MGHDSDTFFDGDDFIYLDIRQLIHLPAWPYDDEGVDLGVLAQTKMNARNH